MIKKIVFAKQPKNQYLQGDVIMDLFQVVAHDTKAVYIKYLVKNNGDLKELNYVSRDDLKERFKKHLNEYVFNSLDELDNALANDYFKLRKKRFENVKDVDYTYVLI